MDVKLNDDTMKTIISKAILDSLTPERREEIISAAVRNLLTERANPNSYNSKNNLQEAFDIAVREIARSVAMHELSKDGALHDKMRQLMLDAWEKMVAGDAYSKLTDNVAGALAKGITGDRY